MISSIQVWTSVWHQLVMTISSWVDMMGEVLGPGTSRTVRCQLSHGVSIYLLFRSGKTEPQRPSFWLSASQPLPAASLSVCCLRISFPPLEDEIFDSGLPEKLESQLRYIKNVIV